MTIFYKFDGKLYANITNKCPCACVFCIRKNSDSIAGKDSLWLEHEPDYDEIIAAFDSFDKTGLDELVFCGYGEPMERSDVLLEVARYVKRTTNMKIRINTNGLVDFINPAFDIYSMRYIIDCVSISLNAPDPESYNEVTRPKYGLPAFNSMLNFAQLAKSVVPEVVFTVVDVISEKQINQCRTLAEGLGIPLRVRHHVTDNESYT